MIVQTEKKTVFGIKKCLTSLRKKERKKDVKMEFSPNYTEPQAQSPVF